MPLEEYRRKRDFAITPEPAPAELTGATGRFVVQRHRATRLHYDFRLEIEGVLVSWAVPKGPTLDPGIRRMAVHVEDHPVEYFDFEGVIPAKQYGAGDVIVWDWGTWTPEAPTLDPRKAVADGELKFRLDGEKLKGRFTIVRTSGRRHSANDPSARAFEDDQGDQWLLIHKRDETSQPGWDAEDYPQSVKTGRTNDDVKADRDALWNGQAPAATAEIDLAGAVDSPDAAEHRADARDPRLEGVQRPRLAVRDQVGRLPGPGRRPRRKGPAVDPQPEGRRGLFPEAPQPADLDRGVARRSSMARSSPSTTRVGPISACSRSGSASARRRRTRVPGIRSALSRRAVVARRPARGPEASASERPSAAPAGPLLAAHIEGEGKAFFEAAKAQRLEGVLAKLRRSRYEPGARTLGLAEGQDPARAGARRRWLDAGGGERARPRRGRGRGLRR